MQKYLTKEDVYYLRSIANQMREVQKRVFEFGPSIGSEVLADNLDYLDCFIDNHYSDPDKKKS